MAAGAATMGAAAPVYETFDLRGNGGLKSSHGFSSGDLTLTATGYKHWNGNLGQQISVGQWSTGLGTQFYGDSDHKVEGSGADEMVVFSFNKEVKLEKVWISYYDRYDDIEVASYSTSLSLLDLKSDVDLDGTVYGSSNTSNDIGWTNLSSVEKLVSSILGLGADHSDDQFKISKIKVSYEGAPPAVPLPASGLLLIGALGGMGALRRRKK